MDRDLKMKKESIRGGPLYMGLACLLIFITLIGFFLNLAPKNSLKNCVKNTNEALFASEEMLGFLKDAFASGSIVLKGETGEILHTGALPEGAALSFTKGKKETRFSFSGDTVTLTHPESKKGYQAKRKGAANALSDSAFTDAGLSEEDLLMLRVYFAMNEKGASNFSLLTDALQNAFDAASPKLSVKNTKEGRESTYQFSSESMMLFFSQISKEGKKEETKEALSSLLTLTAALCDATPDPEKSKDTLSFLTGEGKDFDDFCKKMSGEDHTAALTVLTDDGYVKKVTLSMSGASLSLEGEITFGEDLDKTGKYSVSFTVKEGEETQFSLSFDHKIGEDSKTALIRSWNYKIKDPKGYILGDRVASSGEITFSWGKQKGDLGLRLFLGEKKINFRGAVGDYKKGKELTFTLKRVELDHKNVLHSPMEVTVSRKEAKLSSQKQKGEKKLFPDGEQRTELSEILKNFPY